MRTIISLAIVGLLGFALVRTVPVFWAYVEFRDAIGELTVFSAKRPTEEVANRIMQLADKFDVPLDRQDLTVRRENSTTYVDASYNESLEILPATFYPWEFSLHVEGSPATYTQAMH